MALIIVLEISWAFFSSEWKTEHSRIIVTGITRSP